MTLCVVRKIKTQIFVATDSRLSTQQSHADSCVKLMPLELTIFKSTPVGDKKPEALRKQTLGLVTIGGFENMYLAKELLGLTLSNLQVAEGLADVSMEGVATCCQAVFESLSSTLAEGLLNRVGGELILIGWCPERQEARAFLFRVKQAPQDSTLQFAFRELFADGEEVEYFGSGANAARGLNPTSIFPHDVVRTVVRSKSIPSVGGPVQTGYVGGAQGDFVVVGSQEIVDVNPERKEVCVKFFLGGVEVPTQLTSGQNAYFLRKGYLSADRPRIDDLVLRQGYREVSSTHDW